jgi:hypothetical protein
LVLSDRLHEDGPNFRHFADDDDAMEKIHWTPMSRYPELNNKQTMIMVTEKALTSGPMTSTRFKRIAVNEPKDDTDFLEEGHDYIREGMVNNHLCVVVRRGWWW